MFEPFALLLGNKGQGGVCSRAGLIPKGGSGDRLSLLERGMAAVEAPPGSQRQDQPSTRALASEAPYPIP